MDLLFKKKHFEIKKYSFALRVRHFYYYHYYSAMYFL